MPSQILTSVSTSSTDIRSQDEKLIDLVAEREQEKKITRTSSVARTKTFIAELPIFFAQKQTNGAVSPFTSSDFYLAGALPSASSQGISNVSNIILNINSGYTFRNFPLGTPVNLTAQVWATIFEFNTTVFGTGSNYQPIFSTQIGTLGFDTIGGFSVDVNGTYQLNRTISERGLIGSQRDFNNFAGDQITANEYKKIIDEGYQNLYFGLFVNMAPLTGAQQSFLLAQFNPGAGVTKDFAGFLFTSDFSFTYIGVQNV